MVAPPLEQPHIVFLFSDTGGGHRSAAEAIIEAIHLEFPGQIATEMIDIFRQYAPPPLDMAPEIYPPLVRMPDVWGFGYRISNGPRRTRFFYNMIWPYISRSIRRLLKEHPCDLIVSVHPLINAPVLRAISKRNIPYITVITDLVSAHATWYDARADLTIVPTEAALQRGLKLGLRQDQMEIIGLPVADRFCQPQGEPGEIRARLGWPQDRPMILLVGGGEGMGPLEEIARSINQARLPAALAVITGRNKRLKTTLEQMRWQMPVKIYGFVREMPDFMRAADILVTKAGPGTISEAFIAGLPIILYSRLPGQEEGNVTFVVRQGAGIWAPTPDLVVNSLRRWLEHPTLRLQAAEACQRLARPEAARQIARRLAQHVGVGIEAVER